MSTTGPAPTDAARSAGHLIVAQLEHEGVRRVYGVPGESYLDVLDGLYDSAVTTVVTRHEGGAGFMALAEGRLTGLPGVAMVTRGPGAANAFVAVHTAYQDATPLLLFVGLIPVADRGREAFQEFDLTGWFGSTAKKVVTLDDPASAARVVSEAVHTARSGRPGPVVIGLPEDVIRVRVPGGTVVEPRTATTGRPSAEAVAEVVARVDRAERPVIVVGGESWTDATGAALTAWARERRIPVLADFRAYDAVPHRVPGEPSPYAGSLGYGRADAAAALFDGADLALFVGTARTDVLSDGYTLGGDAETILVLPGDPSATADASTSTWPPPPPGSSPRSPSTATRPSGTTPTGWSGPAPPTRPSPLPNPRGPPTRRTVSSTSPPSWRCCGRSSTATPSSPTARATTRSGPPGTWSTAPAAPSSPHATAPWAWASRPPSPPPSSTPGARWSPWPGTAASS
ncbi:hypothetical protein KGD82_09670 [Nocardiopsis eucommiae]|uniref:Acetolactate synthase n=1 Tax=Nocardiopsis eucommiae TaxID=2831970 RepID=A0A975LBK3_9ACTN|nr:hypothetical protein KGD82_09670 [Nocardiopsis eucommiae]